MMITTLGSKVLHPHQVAAVSWMKDRETDADLCGGLLCDEMGLGKTLTMISHIINSPVKQTLLLTPLAVITQWVRAILSLGSVAPAVYVLQIKRWKHMGGKPKNGKLYLTNYDKLLSKHMPFHNSYDRLICDEAHILRNHQSKKYMRLFKIQRTSTWLITGTPIVNSTKNLSALLSLINPQRFAPNRTLPMDEAATYMHTYALCRTTEQLRDTILASLPEAPKVIHHRLPFRSEEEAVFYRGIQGRLNADLQREMEEDRPDMIMILSLLLRLRQISVHPQIYINSKKRTTQGYARKNWVGDSTKTEAIVDILSKDSGQHGYVIFCHFKEEIALLQERLRKEPFVRDILVYSGDQNTAQRNDSITKSEEYMADAVSYSGKGERVDAILQAAFPNLPILPLDCCGVIEEFLGPSHTIILAQIQCAGTGLNLQHMDRVIFTTPWWTAALMDQAVGRVIRLGQTRSVIVHHLSLDEEQEVSLNIDDFINERVEQKRTICQTLLEAADHRVS
jgi:SNF2 family DNA or RNA helicase